MDKIPQDVKDKMQSYVYKWPGIAQKAAIEDLEYGYSLASEQLLEKDKEIARLNKAIETIYLPIGQQQDQRIKELEDGLRGIFAEPYGCPMCDSGKLRNPEKEHWNDCPFYMAQQLLSSSQSTQ